MSRARKVSEVDPLDTTSFSRTVTNPDDEHDFAGGSALPDVHLTKTRSRRASSFARPFNNILGIKEVVEDDEKFNESDENAEEEQEQDIGEKPEVDANEEDPVFKMDPDVRKESIATIPVLPKGNSYSTSTADQKIEDEESKDAEGPPLEKVKTTRSVRHRRNKQAFHKVALMFGKVYIIIITAFIGVLSIYWGSMYDRTAHLKNLSYLVVIGEEAVSLEAGSLPPLIGATLTAVLNSTSAKAVGTFHFYSKQEFGTIAAEFNNTIEQEVYRRVHHQKYWGAFYVPENATLDYYRALSSSDTSFNSSAIDFIYETARNPSGVPSYVLSVVNNLEKSFVSVASTEVTNNLFNELSDDQLLELSVNGTSLLSHLWFNYEDYRPMAKGIIIGPIQLGLIYLIVLSFHQFNFASATHELIRKKLRLRQYLVYHIITSQGSYLVMSLVYCLMTLAFQVSVTRTFGHSGFLVEWATIFLTMSALGGINENVALQIFARNKAYIGFWIVFFMIINMTSVFSPIPLMNRFYRFGYATPLYNCHELMKVILMDSYKGEMGRNYGILIAWIALANILLPFTLKTTKEHQKRVEARAKKALEDAKNRD